MVVEACLWTAPSAAPVPAIQITVADHAINHATRTHPCLGFIGSLLQSL
jgi:hypothetical protein